MRKALDGAGPRGMVWLNVPLRHHGLGAIATALGVNPLGLPALDRATTPPLNREG